MKQRIELEFDSTTGRAAVTTGFELKASMKSLLQLLNKNSSIRVTGLNLTPSQLEAAYEEKGKLALEAGKFFRKHLLPNKEEWCDIPSLELARSVGLEASLAGAPNARRLEAGDYTDPNNQLGVLNGTLVLLQALPLYAYEYPELAAMFTDFSSAPGLYEQEETTRIVTIPPVQKYNATLDAGGLPMGWTTVSPAVTTDAPVTLTDYIGVPIVQGQATLGATNRDIFAEIAPAAVKAIAGYFVGMMTALITPANYNAYALVTDDNPQTVPVAYATYAKGLSDWSMTDLDKLSAIFTTCKVPRRQRGILINPYYYGKLRSDPRLEFFFAASKGDPQLTEQQLPQGLSGFFPYEAPYLPVNVPFFPFQKAGIILKGRLPQDFVTALKLSPNQIPGSVTTVTDPETKLSMSLVQYVDLHRGYAEWRPEAILGAAVGDKRGGLVGAAQ